MSVEQSTDKRVTPSIALSVPTVVHAPDDDLKKRMLNALEAIRNASCSDKGPDEEELPVWDYPDVDPAVVKEYQKLFAKKASKQPANQLPSNQPSFFD